MYVIDRKIVGEEWVAVNHGDLSETAKELKNQVEQKEVDKKEEARVEAVKLGEAEEEAAVRTIMTETRSQRPMMTTVSTQL